MFSSVIFLNDMGRIPAMCNIYTRVLYLNQSLWPEIPFYSKYFILCHEKGHIISRDQYDELKADRIGFDLYKLSGYPMLNIIDTLSEYLSGNDQNHYERVKQIAGLIKKENENRISKI